MHADLSMGSHGVVAPPDEEPEEHLSTSASAVAFCNMVGAPPASGGGARRVAWDRGRDDALVFGQFRARTVPGAVWRDAGASAQSWLAVGSVSRALPEPVALVGEGDWVERPGGKADVRDFVCLLSGRRCYS